MKKGYTKVAVVLDRSGSMSSIRQATIDGFNEFLKGQKEAEGTATLTLAQFDDYDKYEIIHSGVDIQKVPELNFESFVPRGLTALYDAVAKTIDSVGEDIRQLRESSRPEKVVFVIITDGGENNSAEFSHSDMVQRIEHQQSVYSWQFVFIGANQDALATAKSFSIPVMNAMTYTASPLSVGNTFKRMSENLVTYRSDLRADMSYTEEDRQEQEALNNK